MPITYDESMYAALYNVGNPANDSQRIHYTRELYNLNNQWISRRLDMLPSGQITSAKVAVIGCGFGWLIENAIDAGVASAVGIDGSPYIQANKATESRADVTIIDAIVGVTADNTIKSALQSAGFSRTFNTIIDEDAASSHSDVELPAFLDGCESLLQGGQTANIIHLVTPVSPVGNGDSAVNWKTLADWKAIRPSHTWVDIRTGEVA